MVCTAREHTHIHIMSSNEREPTFEDLYALGFTTPAEERVLAGLTPEQRQYLNRMSVRDYFAMINGIRERKTRLSRDAPAAACPM